MDTLRILMLNWRDMKHPRRGGAELLTEIIARELRDRGHHITLVTSRPPGVEKKENRGRLRIIRKGNEISVRAWALWLWVTQLRKEHWDIVIDQIHGVPFFTPLYIRRPIIGLIYEIAGDFFVTSHYAYAVGVVARWLEPYLLRPYMRHRMITMSSDSRQDLIALGFMSKRISLLPPAIAMQPASSVPEKDTIPTIVYVGRIVAMKDIHELFFVLAYVRSYIPNARLWIAGKADSVYGRQIMERAKQEVGVTCFGEVSEEKKQELLARSWVFVHPAKHEGFGLNIIEAASQGTPAVGYAVGGTKDAIMHNKAGLHAAAVQVNELASTTLRILQDTNIRSRLAQGALERSREITVSHAVDVLEQILREGQLQLTKG